MITANELNNWCEQYLLVTEFSDYCPNGLQVDAGQTITKIITGVTASEALIDQAIEKKADALIVHHGYFWKGEDQRLIGMKGNRIRKLMNHGVSLFAYHLPLDAHPIVGNNAQLAHILGLKNINSLDMGEKNKKSSSAPLFPEQKHSIGNIYNSRPISPQTFAQSIAKKLNRTPLHIASGKQTLEKVAICTGGAQDYIEQAVLMGCDAFISGEISERTTHTAREMGIDYFACGHHATERYGVKAFGELIATQFSIDVEFIDIDNPA